MIGFRTTPELSKPLWVSAMEDPEFLLALKYLKDR